MKSSLTWKKVFVLMLVFIFTLTPMTAMADEVSGEGTQSSSVTSIISVEYVVSIPTSSVIDASTKTVSGVIGVKGATEAGYGLSVNQVSDKVVMNYDSDNALSIKKNSVQADLTVSKNTWFSDELQSNAGSFVYSNINLDAQGLSAGKWVGVAQWEIKYAQVSEATDIILDGGMTAETEMAIGHPAGKTEFWVPALFEENGTIYKITDLSPGFLIGAAYNTITKLHLPSTIVNVRASSLSNNVQEIDGVNITNVEDGAFNEKTALRRCDFGDHLKDIGAGAFYNCSNLCSFNFGNELTSIKMSAFSGCSALGEIILPNTLTYIGATAFSNVGASKIYIPDSVTEIGSNAFEGVAHIYYTGTADDTEGNNWGATALN